MTDSEVEQISAPVDLTLTKQNMLDALLHGHALWSDRQREFFIDWTEKADAKTMLSEAVKTVTECGLLNIHRHTAPPDVEVAAYVAIERLWGELRGD